MGNCTWEMHPNGHQFAPHSGCHKVQTVPQLGPQHSTHQNCNWRRLWIPLISSPEEALQLAEREEQQELEEWIPQRIQPQILLELPWSPLIEIPSPPAR